MLKTNSTCVNYIGNRRLNKPGIPGGGRIPIIGGNMPGGKPGIAGMDGIGIPGINGGIGIELGMDCGVCNCVSAGLVLSLEDAVCCGPSLDPD